MFITKKHLPRRTFLHAAGAMLGLPFLDAMVPALAAQNKMPRLSFIYLPHGAIMDQWTPKEEGTAFELSPILQALKPFRDQINIISGLAHHQADSAAVHSLSPTTWLSGVRPKPTQGTDASAGVTADQIAAQQIGQETLLPSLELGTEDRFWNGRRARSRLWLHLYELDVVEHADHATTHRDQSAPGVRTAFWTKCPYQE